MITVTVWLRLPAVPVTVMLYWPAGVPGVKAGGVVVEVQPAIARVISNPAANSTRPARKRRSPACRLVPITQVNPASRTASRLRPTGPASGEMGGSRREGGAAVLGATVGTEIVKVFPGVTEVGLRVQVDPLGAPAQDRLTD